MASSEESPWWAKQYLLDYHNLFYRGPASDDNRDAGVNRSILTLTGHDLMQVDDDFEVDNQSGADMDEAVEVEEDSRAADADGDGGVDVDEGGNNMDTDGEEEDVDEEEAPAQRSCTNCGATQSYQWFHQKGIRNRNQWNCHPCYRYFRRHGAPRPRHLEEARRSSLLATKAATQAQPSSDEVAQSQFPSSLELRGRLLPVVPLTTRPASRVYHVDGGMYRKKKPECEECTSAMERYGKEWECHYDPNFRRPKGKKPDIYTAPRQAGGTFRRRAVTPEAEDNGPDLVESDVRMDEPRMSDDLPMVQQYAQKKRAPSPIDLTSSSPNISRRAASKSAATFDYHSESEEEEEIVECSSVQELIDILHAMLVNLQAKMETFPQDADILDLREREIALSWNLDHPSLDEFLEEEQRIQASISIEENFKPSHLKANLENCLAMGDWTNGVVD